MKKNILFIAPCFHGYEQHIINKLIEKNYNVSFYPERTYDFWFKCANHISESVLEKKQYNHYMNILKSTEGFHFDYLFVIRGYKIPADFLRGFRKNNPESQMIMYQWDSNFTNPFSGVIQYFDIVYSFDYRDCKELSINYLPLFYTDDVLSSEYTEDFSSDFFFMGTYIPERYSALKHFKEKIKETPYKLNSFIYITKTSHLKEIFKGNKLDRSIISTCHMDRKTYLAMLHSTKVMVDVSNNGQTGLAMRIIEALTLKKKVMTSNPYIKEEPFYNPDNIFVFDANSPIICDEFVNTPFKGIPHTLSLSCWIDRMVLS